MPTKKQIEHAVALIKDAINSDYVQLRGTGYQLGMSEPPGVSVIDPPEKLFPMLETADKIAVLGKYVDWEGFNDAQKQSIIQRVLDGYSPESWMDGIQAEGPAKSQKALFAEWRADYAAAQARDRGEPDGGPTHPNSTVKSNLEKALFGDKRPEVKPEAKTNEKTTEKGGIER